MINDEIRNALNEEELDKEDLHELVYTSDVITMLQDALWKVLNGLTSFEEVYRIIDVDDDLDAQLLPTKKEKKKEKRKNNRTGRRKERGNGKEEPIDLFSIESLSEKQEEKSHSIETL